MFRRRHPQPHTIPLRPRAVRRGKAPTGAGHAHSCGQAAASDPYHPTRWEDCMTTLHVPHTPGVITEDHGRRLPLPGGAWRTGPIAIRRR